MNFYAHLHRVVDEKIGRLLAALGDPGDPGSLRSRTVIARTSDHGELGLSHGGLRQKMFNAYEESIRVPLVVSNPVLFPEPRESDALVSLVDVVPTLLGLARRPGDPERFDGRDLGPLLRAESATPCATPCSSPTTTTRPAPRSRTCPASRTGSAACATRAGSTRSTSTRRARRRPSTSSTTSRATPTRRSTSWTSAPAAAGPRRPSASARGCTSGSREPAPTSGTLAGAAARCGRC